VRAWRTRPVGPRTGGRWVGRETARIDGTTDFDHGVLSPVQPLGTHGCFALFRGICVADELCAREVPAWENIPRQPTARRNTTYT